MNYPEYREKHKIKSIRTPIFLIHTRKDEVSIQEYERIVIETSSYKLKELKEMYRYAWMIQTFHNFGILKI